MMDHHNRYKFFLLFFTLCLVIYLPAFSQILGTMTAEEITQPSPYLNMDSTRAVLVVYSDIEKLGFATNYRGILEIRALEPGIFLVFLYPGTHIITFSADGFRSIDDFRIYIPPKGTKSVQVKAVKEPEGKGSISIKTAPPGASVKLNNAILATKTPIFLGEQPTGRQKIEISLAGYKAIDTLATIRKGDTTFINIALTKETATLVVNTTPDGASVIFEGDSLGVTPLERKDLTPISEGTLILRKEGYETLALKIPLFADKLNSHNFYLIRQSGTVELTANVIGAVIYLDGDSLGIYNGKALSKDKILTGKHNAKASMKGYFDKEEEFDLTFKEVKKVLLELKAKYGALDVMTVPEGAKIYLQGRDTGKKSYSRLANLEPGEYELKVTLEGYQDEIRTVRILPETPELISLTLNIIEEKSIEEKPKEKSSWKWIYIGGGAVAVTAGLVYFSIEQANERPRPSSVTYTIPVNP